MRSVKVGPKKAKTVSKVRRTNKQAYTDNWPAISLRIKKRDNFQCVKCSSTDYLQVDHIVPVAQGGLTVDSNLRTLCSKCHSRLPRHHKHKKFILAASRKKR